MLRLLILFSMIISISSICSSAWAEDVNIYKVDEASEGRLETVEKIKKTDEEWQKILTPQQFNVTRKAGTERAFTGEYWNNHKKGIYKCIACGTDLFSSTTKFESGTGWPSFWEPVNPQNVEIHVDRSLSQERVEVLCRRCEAHLGHVFNDGPAPTHKRFCINSAALKFEEK